MTGGDHVEVGLIGHFRVVSAGRRHELTHSQARLLALLCLRSGDVGREWLAGQLWEDVSTATALRRLRSTMSRLHHSIPGVIRRGRDSVGLSSAVRVDLGEARDRARRLVDGRAEQSVALWSAEPFLDDLLVDWYDEWIDSDRNEFRNLRIHALEVIARHLIATGQFRERDRVVSRRVADGPVPRDDTCLDRAEPSRRGESIRGDRPRPSLRRPRAIRARYGTRRRLGLRRRLTASLVQHSKLP